MHLSSLDQLASHNEILSDITLSSRQVSQHENPFSRCENDRDIHSHHKVRIDGTIMAMLLFFPLLLSVSLFLFSTAFAITPLLTCEKYHWCPIVETAKVRQTSNALSIVVLFSSSFSTMFDSQKLCRIRKDLLRGKLWERVSQAILCHLAVSNGSCCFMAAAASGSNLPERSSTFRLSPSSGWCFWSRFQISRGKWFSPTLR